MAGRVENQYSEIFRNIALETGKDVFAEYNLPDTTTARKKEIEEFVFKVFRDKNEVPFKLWDDAVIHASLRQLSDTRAEEIYSNGTYGLNPIGVNVLDNFFPELLDVRKPSYPFSIRQSFYIDHKLRRVIGKVLKNNGNEMDLFQWLRLTSGYCTNFRPASAKALYEVFGKKSDCKVFDSSAGYGARMLGAHFAYNVREYLGIDPNTADHCQDVINYLDKDFSTNTKKQVLKMGSEDFTKENYPQYQDYFDISFTSPPYFNTEMYSDDETQSWKKFPTYTGWVTGFYKATIYNSINALKADGIFSINIFEKVPNIREITKLFAADKGFFLYQSDKYSLRVMPGSINNKYGTSVSRRELVKESFEPIWMFRHYSSLYKEGLISREQALEFKRRAKLDTKIPTIDL